MTITFFNIINDRSPEGKKVTDERREEAER
jgi:hypothetical protein